MKPIPTPPAVPAAAEARGASPGLHRPGQHAIRAGRPRRRPARSSGPDESTADSGTRARRRAGSPASHSAAAIIATAAVALMAAACSSAPSSARTGRSPNPGGAGTSSNAGEPANAQLSSPAACARMAWRTSLTLRLAPATPSTPARSNSGSAAPSSAQPRPPASTCSRPALTTSFLRPRCRCSCGACSPSPAACAPTECRASPDPAADSEGRPIYPLSARGISLSDSHSQRFNTVVGKCQYLVPRQLGGIPFG
jgi:hypothetical protein